MSVGELAAMVPPMNCEPAPGISVAKGVQVWPPSVEYPNSSLPNQSAIPDKKTGARRGVIDRPARHDVAGIDRAVARWIGIDIAYIKERAIPRSEYRIASWRHNDLIGDQLFYAETLIVEGNGVFWKGFEVRSHSRRRYLQKR